ncbi:MAG: hypothetical protein J2P36_04540, partial [Ktedonobacteraceae bacterium]|nr:hypothetical protein [Ktedonobacteraceae bacterium]
MNEDVRNEQPFQEYPGTQQDSINRPPLPIDVIHAFTRLTPQQVDQFYKGYQYWQLQQQVINRKLRITTLEQQIAENAAQMRQNEPSALALSILAQFQANDVNDIDLLDRMLERGDTWLDHTQQLLERCEQLDMIQGSYTEWCENALEGAYDWIETMDRAESPSAEPQPDSTTPEAISDSDSVVPPTITEEELLRMLMIDTDDTEKIPALRRQKITSPLPPEEPPETSTISPKRTQPLAPIETTEPEASQPEEAAAATATPAAPEQPTDEPETPPEQPEPFTPGDAELPHPLDVATPETVESEANLYALESTGEETGLESAPEAESQEQAATLQTDMPAEPNIPETITEPSEPTTTDQPEIMAEQPELPTTDQSDTTTEQPESSEIEQPELSEAEPPSTDQSAASQEQEFDVPAQEEALTESMPEAALSEPEQPETLPEEEPPAPKISALEQEPAHTQETIEELAPEQPTDEPTQPISTDEPALEQPATPAQPILPDSTLTEA